MVLRGLAKLLGIAALTVGALTVNKHFDERNVIFQEYLRKQPAITKEVIGEGYDFAYSQMPREELGQGFVEIIAGSSLLALSGEYRRKKK